MVPAYQPIMAREMFYRAVFGKDIATGLENTTALTGTGGNGTYGSFPRSGMSQGPFLSLNGTVTVTAQAPQVTMEGLVVPSEGAGPQRVFEMVKNEDM
jgi:hypothetical protein